MLDIDDQKAGKIQSQIPCMLFQFPSPHGVNDTMT